MRHFLVDGGGRVSGVIDWGDAGVGPASSDLTFVWCALPPDRRQAFLDAYGGVTEAMLASARRCAAFLCLALMASCADQGRADLVSGAREGLRRTLRGPG